MSKQLEPKYNHHKVEEGKYRHWIDKKYFEAGDTSKKPYSIVIPPPNVTGKLHLGHAWDTTLQDMIIRYKRMQGYDALWLPGMDHAGIATQAKVEARMREEGISRYDLGRDGFLEKAWSWKEEYASIIRAQWEKLGLSLDYSKERFTLDDGLSEAVKEVFVKLYNEGLIYQGKRIINWDPVQRTALSNIEVIHKEIEGAMYYFKYQIVDSDEQLIIATTRPETMFADQAIFVHPDDERYTHLVGKKAINPANGEALPIMADSYIDMSFGTAVMKCTPAHDPNDFNVGKKHNLPIINMLTKEATVTDEFPKYAGLDRFEARKVMVEDLKESGALIKVENIKHNVGQCYRCQTVVEPRVSKQWFVKTETLAQKALEVVKNGEIKIMPKRMEKIYYNWLENIRDWCISRQLWWGHRIPAWYGPDKYIFVARDENEAKEMAAKHYGKEVELIQEEDVLDTWFSSALWPFSTMGWPEKTKELETFYPTSTLVTGADIIFFWVARMIMFGLYEMKEIPFKDVFFHGIVRDEIGRKMSKSLGNSPDPLNLIDEFGADAIRFSMIYNTSQGQDVHFSEKLLEMGRNFANKIWNVARFVIMNLENFDIKSVNKGDLKLELVDKWIFSRMNETSKEVADYIDKFQLDDAAKAVYEFLRGDFCDWYVELAKVRLYNDDETGKASKITAQYVLWTILEAGLRMLHPFMPFITEEIWQKIKVDGDSIMIQQYPTADELQINRDIENSFEYIKEVISSLRNIKAEMGISPAKEVKVIIKTSDEMELKTLEDNYIFITKLAKIEELKYGKDMTKPDQSGFRVARSSEVYMILTGLLNAEVEIKKIQEQIEKVQKDLDKVNAKLSDERFTSKAPAHILERERRIQKEYQDKMDKLTENLKNFM